MLIQPKYVNAPKKCQSSAMNRKNRHQVVNLDKYFTTQHNLLNLKDDFCSKWVE